MSEFERERDGSGRLGGPAYPDEVFAEAVGELDLPTTVDVAREVGCSRSTAWDRLGELEVDGVVESREVGAALVWSYRD